MLDPLKILDTHSHDEHSNRNIIYCGKGLWESENLLPKIKYATKHLYIRFRYPVEMLSVVTQVRTLGKSLLKVSLGVESSPVHRLVHNRLNKQGSLVTHFHFYIKEN